MTTNFILNDCHLHLKVNEQQLTDYSKEALVSTVLNFASNAAILRNQIITNHLRVILYDDAASFPEHIDNFKKEFNVRLLVNPSAK